MNVWSNGFLHNKTVRVAQRALMHLEVKKYSQEELSKQHTLWWTNIAMENHHS